MRHENRRRGGVAKRPALGWALPALLAAWALALGPGCGEPGAAPDPFAGCAGDRELVWDDERGTLHPEASLPLELGNLYRCASRRLDLECPAGRTPYRQDVNRHLRPGPQPGELVRCVGPGIRA